MPGSTGVSFATPRPPEKLSEALKEEIESGRISLGKLIAPRTYQQLKIDENGVTVTEEFTIHGRKIPLRELREQ